MPTKIVSTESAHLAGEISKEDLTEITGQFKDHIVLSTNNDRPVAKLNEIVIPVEIMQNLIDILPVSQRRNCNVIIRLGITLPSQLDCKDPHTPVGNHLTVVVFLENDNKEKINENDFIITTGFKEFVIQSGSGPMAPPEGACCPVIRPGG